MRRELCAILEQMEAGTSDFIFRQFLHEEDGEPYQVFEITLDGKKYVLKKAKEYEAEIYSEFFSHSPVYVPRIYGRTQYNGDTYLLMEHIAGENLQKCIRVRLKPALDALICMQREFWNAPAGTKGNCYEASLQQRKKRREYLKDAELEKAYDVFLEQYAAVPRTLCHDDLLPFNVLVTDERAVLIDWECGGILPYPVSLARLIAHGKEEKGSLFFMSQEDKEFAVQYYYERLIRQKGIAFEEYRRTLDYFLFYEYCEWVYVGNKFGNTDSEYFKQYLPLAKAAARRLNGGTYGRCIDCAL